MTEITVTCKKLEKVGFDQKRFGRKVNSYAKELQKKKGYSPAEAKEIATKYYNIYHDQFYIWK